MRDRIYFALGGYDYEGVTPIGVIESLDDVKDILEDKGNYYNYVDVVVIDNDKYVAQYRYREGRDRITMWADK